MALREQSRIFGKLSLLPLEMPVNRNFIPQHILWGMLAAIAALINVLSPSIEVLAITGIVIAVLAASSSSMAALLLLLLLSPLRALIATESELSLPLDIGQILLVLYLASWLMRCIALRKPLFKLEREPVLMWLVALCVVFGLGAWTSTSVAAWLREWLKWVVMAVFVWHLALTVRKRWGWLVLAVLTAAAANAVVGLYIFLGGSGAEHLLILRRYFRAFGTFGQPNPFGGFMGLALPLALMSAYGHAQLLWTAHRRTKEINLRPALILLCSLLFTVLIACALVASWSRGAWLGSAVALAIMLFALPKQTYRGVIYALALIALISGLWLTGLLPQSIINRLTTAAGDFVSMEDIRGADISPMNYAVVERIAHWQAAINMARDKPFLGVGLGNYEIAYDNYRLINWKDPLGHAHNLYLNMLAETGLIGLCVYLAFWLRIVALTWRVRVHPDPAARSIAIGLLGCWSYLAVHSVFDNLYVNNLFLHIGVLLGMLAILYRQINHRLTVE